MDLFTDINTDLVHYTMIQAPRCLSQSVYILRASATQLHQYTSQAKHEHKILCPLSLHMHIVKLQGNYYKRHDLQQI